MANFSADENIDPLQNGCRESLSNAINFEDEQNKRPIPPLLASSAAAMPEASASQSQSTTASPIPVPKSCVEKNSKLPAIGPCSPIINGSPHTKSKMIIGSPINPTSLTVNPTLSILPPPLSEDTAFPPSRPNPPIPRLPRCFYCPLTQSPMVDPVIDQEGNSYEKSAILDYLVVQGHKTSPVTKNPLKPYELAVNRALKELIHEYMGPEWSERAEEQISRTAKPSNGNNNLTETSIDKNASTDDNETIESTSNNNPLRRIHHNSRYRTLVDDFLLEIGRTTHLDERLNDAGVCAFAYDGHTFVIEVPEHSGVYLFYTSLGRLEEVRAKNAGEKKDILHTLLHWNYLQKQTRGGVVSLDSTHGNDITFSYYGKVEDVNFADFRTELERFVETSLRLYDKLHKEETINANGEVVRRKVNFGYRYCDLEERRNSI